MHSPPIMSRIGHRVRPARTMLIFSSCWLLSLVFFTNTTTLAAGIPFLPLAGLSQGLGQIPMATMLIRNSDPKFRGRIMGIRMLAIYGNVPGLLIAGWLIPRIGYPMTMTMTIYGLVVVIAARWRGELWVRGAAANSR
jgi:sugar phosphate permease